VYVPKIQEKVPPWWENFKVAKLLANMHCAGYQDG
jgi:hypothetical protein